MAIRRWFFIGIMAAFILTVAVSTGAASAAGVGTVDAVDYETRSIVIDGRTYQLADGVIPRRADNPRSILSLRMLRPGMAVRYETSDGSGQTRIASLLLLATQ